MANFGKLMNKIDDAAKLDALIKSGKVSQVPSPFDTSLIDKYLSPSLPEIPQQTVQDVVEQNIIQSPDLTSPQQVTADPITLTKKFNDEDVNVSEQSEQMGPSELKQLIDDRNSKLSAIGMAEAASDIGRAIAGAGRLPDQKANFGTAKELVNQQVKDYDVLQKDTDEQARRNPNSSLSKTTRQTVVDALRMMGRAQLADSVEQRGLSAKQLEDAFGQYNLNNMLSAHQATEARKAQYAMMAQERRDRKEQSANVKDIARLDNMNKLINDSLARNTTKLGRISNIKRSAEAIEALVGNNDPNKLTPPQVFEIAKSLDAMLSSGATTISGTEHLMPKGYGVKYANVAEFFKNEPQAAAQGGYVKQALHTIEREKNLAKKQLLEEKNKLISSYKDLKNKMPEAWDTVMRTHGLSEDDNSDDTVSSINLHPKVLSGIEAELAKRGGK